MKHFRNISLALLAALLAGGTTLPLGAQPKPAQKPKPKPPATAGQAKPKPAANAGPWTRKKDDSDAFFGNGVVPRLQVYIAPAEMDQLRKQAREYVKCTVIENGQAQYDNVGVHLKGAAGSFRGVDDRPALTLNFDKYVEKQQFHDLTKIHLNNSVQDPTYLNELISSEIFLAAGIPAARTTHARVFLNDRDLGFYVLKEGFNKNFLKRHYPDAKGNLYDGGFVQDLDGQPKLQTGDGPADKSDVKAVVDACRDPDQTRRWQKLEQLVDIDQFLKFAALEHMTCHWDGYTRNRNNYRFYFDPKTKKVHFFPHGMDQMFGDVNYPIQDPSGAMVGSAIMTNPAWRARYREKLEELMKLFVPPTRLLARVDAHHQRLRPVLAQMGAPRANEFDRNVQVLKDKLISRGNIMQRQLAAMPRPAEKVVVSGPVLLEKWDPMAETQDAKLERTDGPANIPSSRTLIITAGKSGRCVASWRSRVMLPAGKYRFEAKVKTVGVKALTESSGTGAGIRLSGGTRANKLDGTAGWTLLSHSFEVHGAQQEVVLVAELRAAAGQAAFDAASLRIVPEK
jgi:hypothetical protein